MGADPMAKLKALGVMQQPPSNTGAVGGVASYKSGTNAVSPSVRSPNGAQHTILTSPLGAVKAPSAPGKTLLGM